MDGYERELFRLLKSVAGTTVKASRSNLQEASHRLLTAWRGQSRFPEFLVEFVQECARSKSRKRILRLFIARQFTVETVIQQLMGCQPVRTAAAIEFPAIPRHTFPAFPRRAPMPEIDRKVKVALHDLIGLRALCKAYCESTKRSSEELNLTGLYRIAVNDQMRLLQQWFEDPLIAQHLDLVWKTLKRHASSNYGEICTRGAVAATELLRRVARSYWLGARAAGAILVAGAADNMCRPVIDDCDDPPLPEIWSRLKQVVSDLVNCRRDIDREPSDVDWQTAINASAVLIASTRNFSCRSPMALADALRRATRALFMMKMNDVVEPPPTCTRSAA